MPETWRNFWLRSSGRAERPRISASCPATPFCNGCSAILTGLHGTSPKKTAARFWVFSLSNPIAICRPKPAISPASSAWGKRVLAPGRSCSRRHVRPPRSWAIAGSTARSMRITRTDWPITKAAALKTMRPTLTGNRVLGTAATRSASGMIRRRPDPILAYRGDRFANIRCNVRRCMFRRRAVSDTLRSQSS